VTIGPDTLVRRSFRLTVGSKQFGSDSDVRPLSFTFNVQRDKTLTPNNANILLYNLSPETRAELEELSGGFGQGTARAPKRKLGSTRKKKSSAVNKPKVSVPQAPAGFPGVVVRLEVGYQEKLGQIFFGVLRKVSSWKQGADWLTQISGGDSEHSITTAKISKTFVKGTPVTAVVRELVTTLGVGKGGLDNTLAALGATGLLTGGVTLQQALTLHGDSATALEQLMRSCGFEWQLADGNFYAAPKGTPMLPGEGPLLTPETGLLDTPQIDKQGRVIGKALLNPDLLPGRVFRVESTRVTGTFLCEKTQHSGTSDSELWEVQFVGRAPDPGSKAARLAEALGDTGFKVFR
jgi:hypothetical protein